MANRYRWSDEDIRALKDKTQIIVDALTETSCLVNQLTSDMAKTTQWTGAAQLSFAAWMDLVRQLHEKLAASDIGSAAIDKLDDFLRNLSSFERNSDQYRSLDSV